VGQSRDSSRCFGSDRKMSQHDITCCIQSGKIWLGNIEVDWRDRAQQRALSIKPFRLNAGPYYREDNECWWCQDGDAGNQRPKNPSFQDCHSRIMRDITARSVKYLAHAGRTRFDFGAANDRDSQNSNGVRLCFSKAEHIEERACRSDRERIITLIQTRSLARYKGHRPIRAMADGSLDSQVGARICNGLGIMRACLETATLERLEGRLDQMEGMPPNYGNNHEDRPACRPH
jgi:hypothetical protein